MELREKFEAWASDDGKWPKAVERNARGNYLLASTGTAWTVWQAAWNERKALDVEMCLERTLYTGYDCAQAIKEA